tara:strand:- start:2376 stop:4409 length:2034 start_codon:yes stop_codon:yes gene_type:complete
MIKKYFEKKVVLVFFSFFMFIVVPFSISDINDEIMPKEINENTVGFYQSTTCKISFFEVVTKNMFNQNNLYINSNTYPGLNCFGKVTGLDRVNDTYILSIGTNPNLSFLLQMFLWISAVFIISNKREVKYKLSYFPALIIPILFTSQHYFENRFYKSSNIYFNQNLEIQNYYLLTKFVGFLFISLLIKDLYERRTVNILNLIPFLFIFNGTFHGHNINIYIVIFSYFGLQALISKKTNLVANSIYFLFSVVWLFNFQESSNYFDGDKLVGFINTSENLGSQVFWTITFYLVINGMIYLFKNEKIESSLEDLKNSFLISGGLVVFFGIIGSASAYINFLNFLIFGQNKRGMRDLNSVAGNAWRGFAPSAEYIGEFFGLCVFITFFYFIKTKNKFLIKDFVLLSVCLFGLYKSNNFSSITTLLLLSFTLLFKKSFKFEINKKSMTIILLSFLILVTLILQNIEYERYSSALIEESILHSNLFQYDDPFKNDFTKKSYFLEKDYKTILLLNDNHERASTSLKVMVEAYSQNINISFIPNPISLISTISLFINRTEMWGIFIAKYNPNLLSSLFGYGPFQMIEYLNGHKVELDVPDYKTTSLFLPHSSFLDGLLFFGIVGMALLCIGLYFVFRTKLNNGVYKFILFFYTINLLKSDSILYFPCFALFIFVILKILKLEQYE